jgi:transcriptional regulator with XRE-family HTH domain
MPPVAKPKRQRQRHFIRQWRKYRGLSQEEAGERIGMSATNWGRIEKNEVPYSQDFLEEAAIVLKCRTWDLLNRDPETDGPSVDLLFGLDGEKRAEAENFLRYLSGKS